MTNLSDKKVITYVRRFFTVAVMAAALLASLGIIIFFGYKYADVRKNIDNLTSADFYSVYECEYVLGLPRTELESILGEALSDKNVNEEHSGIVSNNALTCTYPCAKVYYHTASLSDGTRDSVSYRAVLCTDIIPPPRDIHMGMSVKQVESKYPVDTSLNERGKYDNSGTPCEYRLLYGEMGVGKYAYELWSKDARNPTVLSVVYADGNSYISYAFSGGKLVSVEYLQS